MGWDPTILLKGIPLNDLKASQQAYFLKVLPPPNRAKLGTTHLT
jgi:hypothetical protein